MLAPLLEKTVGELGGEVLLAKVNTDENQRLALQFQIRALPTVLVFREGRPMAEFEGVLPEEQLRQFLRQIAPGEAEQLAREAAALEQSDPARAEALYRQALAKDPRQDRAIVGLARALGAQNRDDEAAKLLEDAAVGADQEEEVERVRGILTLKKLARQFGDEATLRQQLAADPNNARVRYQLGVVLAVAGKYQESLDLLLAAGERDPGLATTAVREAMVQVFHVVGNQSALANEYRPKLASLLY
jgi:putative thioredoxin